MSVHNLVHGRENQIVALFEQMPDQDAIRLIAKLIDRFSGYDRHHDRAVDAIEGIAEQLADDLGYAEYERILHPQFLASGNGVWL